MISNCPGASRYKQPQAEIIKCTHCGADIEIWTDEPKARCSKCHRTVIRKQGQSCLDWCRYAKECVGEKTYSTYMRHKSASLRQKLIEGLEAHFGEDTKRITHAKKVMHFAEELLKREKGDWHVVIPASILHDVGIKEAEKKYGTAAGHYQEKEGPAIARKILLAVGGKKEDIDEICEIIAHHHTPGAVDSMNFKILYDADWLVNLEESVGGKESGQIARIIDKTFLTKAGKEFATKLYIHKKEI